MIDRQDAAANIFASLDTLDAELNIDALDEWLQSPPLLSVNDLLGFWASQFSGPNKPLASMALGFLSVPGTFTLSPQGCMFTDIIGSRFDRC